jgi:hypothetical protein
MALMLTQPVTEMSTRDLPVGKEWPACKADNLAVICEAMVSMGSCRHTFTLYDTVLH